VTPPLLPTHRLNHHSLTLRSPELESQTQHLRARAAKADSSSEGLAEAASSLAAREQQLQEANEENEQLRDLAQVG